MSAGLPTRNHWQVPVGALTKEQEQLSAMPLMGMMWQVSAGSPPLELGLWAGTVLMCCTAVKMMSVAAG